MDLRLRNKDRKKDKKDEKSLASKEVVTKANSSRGEIDITARDMSSTMDEAEDVQSGGVLPTVLKEIRELNKSLSEKIDSSSAQLQASINGVKATLDKVLTRVAEAENRISETEDAVSELKQLTKQLKGDNDFLKKKIDQLENHSRRNNIRVLGLKEGTEGTDPVKFFTNWIPEVLGASGPDAAAQRLEVEIERAHRTATMEPRPGEPPRTTPRPVLIRLLRFQDREKILALAKKRGNISYGNMKINFFPDMSPELARRRKQLVPALQAIKGRNIPCYLIYPARLKVQSEVGGPRFFDSADEAFKFINSLVQREQQMSMASDH